jgi:ABC-type amino acid transport system permease subunit
MRLILVPQAVRRMLPAIVSQLVTLLKDTSLLAFVGTTTATVELTQFGRNAFNEDFNGSVMILCRHLNWNRLKVKRQGFYCL